MSVLLARSYVWQPFPTSSVNLPSGQDQAPSQWSHHSGDRAGSLSQFFPPALESAWLILWVHSICNSWLMFGEHVIHKYISLNLRNLIRNEHVLSALYFPFCQVEFIHDGRSWNSQFGPWDGLLGLNKESNVIKEILFPDGPHELLTSRLLRGEE